ncbi:MAG TPA: WD40 repeat domain-containing protein [Anaerolineales bacterium]|nr:WD40 repeat domain-containing protein [Anaerolineales bacterium]HLO30202.1 WD40 repeat domain-containing protein [Anaerolineales bacterium]
MTKRFLAFLLSCLLLESCSTGNNLPVISTVTPEYQISSTPTSSPTSTQTEVVTPTASPEAMKYQCLDVTDRPPANYILKGTLVFDNDDNTDAYFLNKDTNNVYRFRRGKHERLWGFEVSPDRKHIAYMRSTVDSPTMVAAVATADGWPVWSQATNSFLWTWFDNERLVRFFFPENGSASLFLLNPFTHERQDLQTDYPHSEMFANKPIPRWRFTGGGFPIYDPLLTRVIYPESRSQIQGKGWPIALWDTEAGKLITRIITMDDWGETPLWTPDGKQFILATNLDPNRLYKPANEFFAVSRDGEARQLTHFLDSYQEINILDGYNLSPDGKRLAFWMGAKPSRFDDFRLAVLNIETGEVTNYCVMGGPFINHETTPLSDPMWSPDSTQLLVVNRNPQDTKIRRVVLIDLGHSYAAQIGEDVEPVGWMVSP